MNYWQQSSNKTHWLKRGIKSNKALWEWQESSSKQWGWNDSEQVSDLPGVIFNQPWTPRCQIPINNQLSSVNFKCLCTFYQGALIRLSIQAKRVLLINQNQMEIASTRKMQVQLSSYSTIPHSSVVAHWTVNWCVLGFISATGRYMYVLPASKKCWFIILSKSM